MVPEIGKGRAWAERSVEGDHGGTGSDGAGGGNGESTGGGGNYDCCWEDNSFNGSTSAGSSNELINTSSSSTSASSTCGCGSVRKILDLGCCASVFFTNGSTSSTAYGCAIICSSSITISGAGGSRFGVLSCNSGADIGGHVE